MSKIDKRAIRNPSTASPSKASRAERAIRSGLLAHGLRVPPSHPERAGQWPGISFKLPRNASCHLQRRGRAGFEPASLRPNGDRPGRTVLAKVDRPPSSPATRSESIPRRRILAATRRRFAPPAIITG